MTPTTAQQMAESVVADGFAAHHATVDAFVAAARTRGVCSVFVDVVADPSAPTVARFRALGRAVVAYVAAGDTCGTGVSSARASVAA